MIRRYASRLQNHNTLNEEEKIKNKANITITNSAIAIPTEIMQSNSGCY